MARATAMTGDWQAAYLAVSVLLGESIEDAVSLLDASSHVRAPEVLRDLRSTLRETRARAMARVVSELVVALDDARLA